MKNSMPETIEELQAIITERILDYDQKLRMDGRLLPSERPQYGYEVTSKPHLNDSVPAQAGVRL